MRNYLIVACLVFLATLWTVYFAVLLIARLDTLDQRVTTLETIRVVQIAPLRHPEPRLEGWVPLRVPINMRYD